MSSRHFIIIAGTVDDLLFHHACFIAINLVRLLPNFYFKRICKDAAEWQAWVDAICKLHDWKHTGSPLIWKQCGMTDTKATYIGDAKKFREFLLKYYNIHFDLTREELEALKMDLLLAHKTEQKIACSRIQGEYRHVTVIGAARSLCLDLIPRLAEIKELQLSYGIAISLYDKPERFTKLKKVAQDIKEITEGSNAVALIRDVPSGLSDCDILIFLEDIAREDCKSHDVWYRKNYERMSELSKQINRYAPSHMRVIFCSSGPMCLCATIVQNLATKLSRTNIVVISAHYGLQVMRDLAKHLNPRDFGCPPVWGFIGISRFVDVCHMVLEYDVSRRNVGFSRAKESAILSAEVERSELRWFFRDARNKNLYEDYLQNMIAQSIDQIDQPEDSHKCKAICDLLKLWYKENVDDEIIALGISSDGKSHNN